MRSLLIGMFSILVGCGNATSYVVEDPALESYVEWFQAEAQKRKVVLDMLDLVIKFGQTITPEQPNRIGYCSFSGPRTIVIDASYFLRVSEARRKALIAHEMGHCVLYRPHDNRCIVQVGSKCLVSHSLMHPVLDSVDFQNNEMYYLDELFSKGYGTK